MLRVTLPKILISNFHPEIDFAHNSSSNFTWQVHNKYEIISEKLKFSDRNFWHPGMCSKLSGELENFTRLGAVSSFKTSKFPSYKQRPFVLIIAIIAIISFN